MPRRANKKKRFFSQLLLALFAVVALTAATVAGWLYLVGLPAWAQRRLAAELERSGLTASYQRLRLDFRRGIVAENVHFRFRGSAQAEGETREMIIGIRPTNWLRNQLVTESLTLSNASFWATVPPSKEKVRVERASARARLASDGMIDLDALHATVMGVQFRARGYLVPPRKRLPLPSPPAQPPRQQQGASAQETPSEHRENVVDQILRAVQETQFATPPRLSVEFHGDWNDPGRSGFRADFSCGAARRGDWAVKSLTASVRLEEQVVLIESLRAEVFDGAVEAGGRYDLASAAFAVRVKSDADLAQAKSLLPKEWRELVEPLTPHSRLKLDALVRTEAIAPRDPIVEGRVELGAFAYKELKAQSAEGEIELTKERLRLRDLRLAVADGEVRGEYEQQLATGEFVAKIESTAQIEPLEPLLPKNPRNFVSQFRFGPEAPRLSGEARGNWRNPETIEVTGHLELKDFTFRTVPISRFVGDARISDGYGTVSNIVLTRPEGEARGTYRAGLTNNLFTIQFDSRIDPHALKPVLEREAREFIDRFEFEQPPRVVGKMSGHWYDIHQLQFDGFVESGPLKINGVPFARAATKIQHAHDRSHLTEMILKRDEGEIRGSALYDYDHPWAEVKLTSSADPHAVAGMFGPHAAETLEPYQFGAPPQLEMEGRLDFRESGGTDLRVKITGQKFRYWKFMAEEVRTLLTIKDRVLTLQDFDSVFYGGRLHGAAEFQLESSPLQFRADVNVRESELRDILEAMTGARSEVRGLLSGKFHFQATTEGSQSIEGAGRASVKDGLIWEVPLFGVVSKAVSTVLPAFGYSRATDAKMTFVVSRGTLRTEDLIIDAGTTRLSYRGGYDLQKGGLDMDVEAHLLGSTRIGFLGWVFKPLTKLFEFHVHGTLAEPRLRPLYLPKEIFGIR